MPVLARLLLLACLALPGCQRTAPAPGAEIPVRVRMVAVDDMNVPVVVLEEVSGERWLPIWIGTSEAHSIASQMDDRRPLRPNSHDLAIRLIQRLDGEVERVVVTELKGGTYYAILSLHAGDADIEIDARPSDAIAIALRAGAPIFVREGVFAQAEERSAEPADEQRIRAAPFGGADRDGGPTGTPPATRHRTL